MPQGTPATPPRSSADQAREAEMSAKELNLVLIEEIRGLRADLVQLGQRVGDQPRGETRPEGMVPLHPGNEPPAGGRNKAGARPRSPHVETGRTGEGEES